jgi:hypothetical protein
MKRLFTCLVVVLIGISIQAQTTEELTAQKTAKETELATLQAQVAALEGEIATISQSLVTYPYWDKGSGGIIGADINSFNNWASRGENLNSSASNIGIAFNGFANKMGEGYFWRNNGQLTLGWQKFSKNADSDSKFEKTADVFNVQSLYGKKLSDKLAASALGELRTTFLDNSFDPAYIDLGVGFTWTPIPEFVAVFHPLNYNIIIADGNSNFESSLGCKVVADYARDLGKGVSYRTNLSGFLSYKDASGLSNYTWVNGLNFKVLGDLGVGIEYAIRRSKQETISLGDKHFQSYFLMGVSYNL